MQDDRGVFMVEHNGCQIPIFCKWEPVDYEKSKTATDYHLVSILASCYSDNTLVTATEAVSTWSLESFPPDSAAISFFNTLAEQLGRSPSRVLQARLILPAKAGYLASTTILYDRLLDFQHELKVLSFVLPSQRLESTPRGEPSKYGLLDFLSSAAGAVIVTEDAPQLGSGLSSELDAFLATRLYRGWIYDKVMPTTTLGLIGGRPQISLHRPISDAARSLGINLVLFERQGHWLEKTDCLTKTLRMDFVPLDISPDDGLHHRIVSAVRACPVNLDGILTTFDEYLVSVAKAAKTLGFPTQPVKAYNIATDKYRTRVHPDVVQNGEAIAIADRSDLHETLANGELELEFPVIVKPRQGCGSDGVSKAQDTSELLEATNRSMSWHEKGVVIEHYVDGPEVDANFVLSQGEILFFEVSDDLPSNGDEPDADIRADFSERGIVSPSALPEAEITEIRISIHKTLLSMGFDTGVFHTEARLQNSSMEYGTKRGGYVDLQSKKITDLESPFCFLLEVNARPPGVFANLSIRYTYGVDFLSLAMLAALGHHSRMRILAKSFCYPERRDAQYHNQLVLIPAKAGGRLDLDICSQVRKSHPDLVRGYVATCGNVLRRESTVPDPEDGTNSLLAWFNVQSRKSREDAMKAACAIEHAVDQILK